MSLIHDEGIVFIEVGILLGLGEQDPVRHDLDVGVPAGLLPKTDLVAYRSSDLLPKFLRNTPPNGGRRDPAGLGAADLPTDAPPRFQTHLGDLGTFSRTGLAGYDDHLIFSDGMDDFILL